ncbi:anthranilate synthase component I family protein [Candidatus Velamenicoccus archaeovorus]|nr:anthranilate synthase component I family protein [Candidatus Velamenicoccus archaeovorus]
MMHVSYKLIKGPAPVRRYFGSFSGEPHAFLLESAQGHSRRGRFSFFGVLPFAVLRCQNGRTTLKKGNREEEIKDSVGGFLRSCLEEYVLAEDERLAYPFLCGAAGFVGYDFGFSFENIRRRKKPPTGVPDVLFGLYDGAAVFDRLKNEMLVFSSGFPEHGRSRKKRARRRLEEMLAALEASGPDGRVLRQEPFLPGPSDWRSDFTKKGYLAAVRKAKGHIAAGDIYQINLSQRFTGRTSLEDWQLYERLVRAFPVSFGAFFRGDDFSIISASPEQFLSYDGRTVTTRPMKGTRPRTGDRRKDGRNRRELWESAKEKAELLMVVDLERNDLGRVCDYGTVRLRQKRTIEAYRTVFQATSEIEGRLGPSCDRWDLLRACFPGGSITGCPKIRAMELIEELEPVARGIYTGSLGYMSFHETLQFSILIRTLLKQKERVSFHVGGGIVADSDPRKEYEETLVKARVLFEALTGKQEL